jgi:hypothetical protein
MFPRVCLFFFLLAAPWRPLDAADCNHNGAEDDAEIAAGARADCNADGVPDECQATPLHFGFRENPGLDLEDGEPRVAVTADLSGDGLFDLVVGNVNNSISLYLGEDGEAFTAKPDFPTGTTSDFDVVDFDGDGDLDIATVGSGRLSLVENDGSGNLVALAEYSTPVGTTVVCSGDLNQDGAMDIVALSRLRHDVLVYMNQGDTTFAEEVVYEGGKLPSFLVVVDLNGDGALDIATANQRSNDYSVFPNLGDGTYGESTQIPAAAKPNLLAAVDLDADGDADLVSGTEEAVSIRFNPGDGLFSAPAIRYPLSTKFLQCADLDADGDADLAWANSEGNRIHFVENFSGGRFGEPVTVIADAKILLSGDVDEDGSRDLILVTRVPNLASFLFGGVIGSSAVTFETSIADISQEPHHAHLADVDQDGDLDAITGNGDNVSYSILVNDGAGTFAEPRTRNLTEVIRPTPTRDSPSRVDGVQTGDIDGDGKIDLLTADGWRNLVRVYYGNGDGTFGEHREFPTGRGTFNYRLGDLDGDSDLDLVAPLARQNAIAVLFNDGSGGLDERVVLATGDGPFGAIDGDFNGDGIGDIAVSHSHAASVSVFLSRGDGTFEERTDFPVGAAPRSVITADFDEDGDLDLVTSNASSRDLTIILNRGNGTFGPPTAFWMRLVPFDAVPVDINLDGHIDVAVANEENHTISIVLGRGDGTFLPPFQKDNNTGRGLRFVLVGDINLDGVVDLVGANRQSQDLTLHINQLGVQRQSLEDFTGQICTGRDFHAWSLETGAGTLVDRALKYTLSAKDDVELLDTLFHNIQRFQLHQEFLQAVFPDRFPSLTSEEYNRLTGRRATRDYFVGVISRLRRSDGLAYGFTVLVDGSDPAEELEQGEVLSVFEKLRESFTLEPLGYFPQTASAKETASTWSDASFPIYVEDGPPTLPYQAYTRAVGYGRVRILEPEEFAAANESGQISFQTVLVLREAPRDIEGVVGGVITAQPQGELSHVAIRTARRRTPNAFVANAVETFAPFNGKLVRLEVTASGYTVEEVNDEEAEAFWAQNRPQLSQLPQLDEEFSELSSLAEIAQMDLDAAQEIRFGGKATNLARLGHILEGSEFDEYREVGFGIPVHYYLEFLRTNTIPSTLDAAREVTYEEYLFELFAQANFKTDSAVRFTALHSFRVFARDKGVVSEPLVERILQRIGEVFPSTRTPLRCRSSSNVEDALEFNGAGLYESTGVCADDDLDGDEDGPSLCDPSKTNERTVRRALLKVWTSIYTFRAFEERSFYGIPEEQVGMGILISRAFPDELANGVCFTGNFANPLDRRYVVTAQLGEESVVSPDPGVLPEKDLLEVRDGEVVEIIRPRQGSTLVEPGTWVLADEHLSEMGRFLAFVDENFPLDLGDHSRDEVLLDLEFKLEPDNTLAFKQVRPFLLTEPPQPAPEFALEIPENRVLCGQFGLAGAERGPRDEYELKSQVRLRGGTVVLPTAQDSFTEELFDEVRFGPTQELAESLGPGRFRVVTFPGPDETTVYRFTYEKPYALADGRQLDVGIRVPILFTARGSEPLDPPLVMDEAFFTTRPASEVIQAAVDGIPLARYGSCEHLNLPRFELQIELTDGTRVELEERFEEQESVFETGPASLQRAVVEIAGERREVTDYWRLVYSAFRHNTRLRYWVVFDQPVRVPSLERDVRAIELQVPEEEVEEPQASYLGEDFEVLAQVGLASFQKTEAGAEPVFIRGDVTGDGGLNLADAVDLLDYLFRRAAPPVCVKTADWNDSGTINLADAIGLLGFVFRDGAAAAEPFGECGADATADGLSCGGYPPCE